jgi:hypothetical protein
MTTWNQGRDVIKRLLAGHELERVPPNREIAGRIIAKARQDVATAVKFRGDGRDAVAHNLLYEAARRAMAAVLEVQGLRPDTRGDRRSYFEVSCAQVVCDAARAQFDPPHGAAVETLARLIREVTAAEYEFVPAPVITERDVRAVTDVIDLAEGLLDQMPPF